MLNAQSKRQEKQEWMTLLHHARAKKKSARMQKNNHNYAQWTLSFTFIPSICLAWPPPTAVDCSPVDVVLHSSHIFSTVDMKRRENDLTHTSSSSKLANIVRKSNIWISKSSLLSLDHSWSCSSSSLSLIENNAREKKNLWWTGTRKWALSNPLYFSLCIIDRSLFPDYNKSSSLSVARSSSSSESH